MGEQLEPLESGAFRAIRKLGITVWTLIGCVILLAVAAMSLAAVSELVLPLVFAVMVGAALYPVAQRLHRWMKPGWAAMVVVLGSLGVLVGVTVLIVKNVSRQLGEMSLQFDQALDEVGGSTDAVGLGVEELDKMRAAIADLAALIGRGIVSLFVGGVAALTGFIAGIILAVLIGYYVLKDGPDIKAWLVRQFPTGIRAEVDDYLSTGVRSIRSYWRGRTVLSVVVSLAISVVSLIMGLPLVGTIAIVNFMGGYVPYVGAFIGGGLATLLAFADGGLREGLVMLVFVLAANLLLENLLEPKVMSEQLSIHPLVVLLATTLGGILGGMVGLVLAVPAAVLVIDLVRRVKASGVTEQLPQRVKDLQDKVLDPD